MAKKKEEAVETESTEAKSKVKEKKEAKKDTRAEEIALAETLKELDEAKKALAESEDKYLRILAEYDNFKKRTAREKDEIYFASKADVIKKLLPVFDNFDRAQKFSEAEDYRKGVDMIIAQFFQILDAMEVKSVAAEGDAFDPVFHEAVFREEKEGVEENTVTEVLQKGYAVGDKVIRHAMVKVSG